jgi:hypothetical protein
MYFKGWGFLGVVIFLFYPLGPRLRGGDKFGGIDRSHCISD